MDFVLCPCRLTFSIAFCADFATPRSLQRHLLLNTEEDVTNFNRLKSANSCASFFGHWSERKKEKPRKSKKEDEDEV